MGALRYLSISCQIAVQHWGLPHKGSSHLHHRCPLARSHTRFLRVSPPTLVNAPKSSIYFFSYLSATPRHRHKASQAFPPSYMSTQILVPSVHPRTPSSTSVPELRTNWNLLKRVLVPGMGTYSGRSPGILGFRYRYITLMPCISRVA